MKVAGFNFQKGKFRVVILERVKSEIRFAAKKSVVVDPSLICRRWPIAMSQIFEPLYWNMHRRL
jgi:hypothetical protein